MDDTLRLSVSSDNDISRYHLTMRIIITVIVCGFVPCLIKTALFKGYQYILKRSSCAAIQKEASLKKWVFLYKSSLSPYATIVLLYRCSLYKKLREPILWPCVDFRHDACPLNFFGNSVKEEVHLVLLKNSITPCYHWRSGFFIHWRVSFMQTFEHLSGRAENLEWFNAL